MGGRLVTLYIVGRKSGRRYTVPVAYTRHDGGLLIGTPFAWGRNLRTGEPVEIRLKGRRRLADVQAFTNQAGVTERYAVMARDNQSFARFNKSAWTRTVARTRPTFTWPGPQAPGPSSWHRADAVPSLSGPGGAARERSAAGLPQVAPREYVDERHQRDKTEDPPRQFSAPPLKSGRSVARSIHMRTTAKGCRKQTRISNSFFIT